MKNNKIIYIVIGILTLIILFFAGFAIGQQNVKSEVVKEFNETFENLGDSFFESFGEVNNYDDLRIFLNELQESFEDVYNDLPSSENPYEREELDSEIYDENTKLLYDL